LTSEAAFDVILDVLVDSWPEVRGGDFQIGFLICIVPAKVSIVGFVYGFLLILFWQV
jgi:hypothetical protein